EVMKAKILCLALGLAVWAFAACGDDTAVHETPPDAGSSSSSGGSDTGAPPQDGSSSGSDSTPPQDWFTNPQTHFEIINAGTDSQKVGKPPNLPLLLADGGLPALP